MPLCLVKTNLSIFKGKHNGILRFWKYVHFFYDVFVITLANIDPLTEHLYVQQSLLCKALMDEFSRNRAHIVKPLHNTLNSGLLESNPTHGKSYVIFYPNTHYILGSYK